MAWSGLGMAAVLSTGSGRGVSAAAGLAGTLLKSPGAPFLASKRRADVYTDPHPPLHGLRVLDASRVLVGPFCGQLLGDLGAEVIKVEKPGAGDETRAWGPPFAGPLSAYFLSCNRNKRAL